MEWALILVPLVYLILTPYTKVEESFNIQAAHDVLFHQANISGYDHLEFPGVVPRTFIGPVFLASVSAPFIFLSDRLGIGSHFFGQYIVRTVLYLCVVLSLLRLKRALQTNLGARWGWWFVLVTISQYHLLYYSSRPLPNILTLPLVLLAVATAFDPNGNKYFLLLSGAAIIWFRAELAILLGILLLVQIFYRKITITEVIKTAVPAGIVLVAVTVAVDSIFWQRLVWPEAEVFYFNTILNKSSDWGTSPFLWYFYSALPRGLGTSLFLIPIGLYFEHRVRRLVFAAVAFILIFSFLPHKELRFIIYTFPLLNTAAAAACHRLWENRKKSLLRWLLSLGVIGHLILNVTFTVFLLMVARVNYPGGEAITLLHQLIPADATVHVHIDNLAAQTGVSRFTQLNENWRYSKEENLEPGSRKMLQFTHLIIEAKSKYSANLKPYAKTHSIIASVDGFAEVAMNHQLFPPVRIKTKPLIFILARNSDFVPEPELPDDAAVKSQQEIEDQPEAVYKRTTISAEEVDETSEDLTEIDSENDVLSETFTATADKEEEEEKAVDLDVEPPSQSEEDSEDEFSQPVQELGEEKENKVQPEETDKPVYSGNETEEADDRESVVTGNEEQDDVSEKRLQFEEEEYDDDDLLATESNERLVESLDFQPIVKDLEEMLNSNTGNIDEVLLNDDVISYIKALTKVEYNGPQDKEKLRKALTSILTGFKNSRNDVDASYEN